MFLPEIRQLPAFLSTLLSLYENAVAEVPELHLASVLGSDSLEFEFGQNPAGRLSAQDSGRLKLAFEGRVKEAPGQDERTLRLALEDGSTLTAKHASVTRQGTSLKVGAPATFTTELDLSEWRWETDAKPVAWVAVLRGAEAHWTHNLHIEGHGKASYEALRLKGNAAWHFVRKGAFGKRTYVVVIDMEGADVERASLWHDFAALEFLFGAALQMDTLVGVNERNEAVAAYGASFGYRYRPGAHRDPPLPDERDEAWMAVAFPLIVRALAGSAPNGTSAAVCGYVDSTVGHIDGQYLFAQVALEALSLRMTPQLKPVVKDVAIWERWVKSIRPLFAEHAADAAAVDVLAVKLRDAARPTTSKLVMRTMEALGVKVPPSGLKEVGGRDSVAHTFSMTEGQPYDVERDLRRIRIVRTLLAAMVLKGAGYHGALADWELDERRWRKQADWY